MTKRFVMFSSLLAVVAMFLGLMVTGCSEGDNTPAGEQVPVVKISFDQDTTGGKAPAKAIKYGVKLMDKDGMSIAAQDFTNASEGYKKEGNLVTLTFKLKDDQVAALNGKADVVVNAFDDKDAFLGTFAEAGVTINSQGVTPVEFTADEDFKEVAKLSRSLDVDPITVEVGKSEVVKVDLVYSTAEDGGIDVYTEKTEAFEMKVEGTNIEVNNDKHTVTGVAESKDNKLTVTLKADPKVSKVVSVEVTKPAPTYTAKAYDKDDKEDTKFTVGDKITIKVFDPDNKEVEASLLTFKADGTYVTGTANPFDATAVGSGFVEVAIKDVAEPVKAEVTVTAPKFDVTLDYAEGCEPQAGEVVTVEYAIGSDPSEEVDLDKDNVICSGVEGTTVKIVNVWLQRDTEDEQVATLDVDGVTISATKPNVVTVKAWNPAPVTEYEVTMKIGADVAKPAFGEDEYVWIEYSVDGDDVPHTVKMDKDNFPFWKDAEGTVVKIESATHFNAGGSEMAVAKLDKDSVTIDADPTKNVVTVTGWNPPTP